MKNKPVKIYWAGQLGEVVQATKDRILLRFVWGEMWLGRAANLYYADPKGPRV